MEVSVCPVSCCQVTTTCEAPLCRLHWWRVPTGIKFAFWMTLEDWFEAMRCHKAECPCVERATSDLDEMMEFVIGVAEKGALNKGDK